MSNNTLNIWDWSSNQILLTLNWSPQAMPSAGAYAYANIKFLANGRLAAPSASRINVWNVITGQVTLSLNHQGVYALEQLNTLLILNFCGIIGFYENLKFWSFFDF
jgi:hypothetical protein